MISLPLEPFNPDPNEVFKDVSGNFFNIEDRLVRYDHNELGYKTYSPFSPDEFGLCKRGDGYWLSLDQPTTITYEGILLSGPLEIQLPTKGWYMIGIANIEESLPNNPNLQVKNKTTSQTLSFQDAVNAGWIGTPLFGWYPQELRYWSVSLDGAPIDDDSVLKPWNGYWLNVYTDNLALIIPSSSSGGGGLDDIDDDSTGNIL